MVQNQNLRGMKTFLTIWLGQLVSLIGSGLTAFGIGVWLYQETGSVTLFALNSLFFILPQMLFSPFAGALVDRWDRRRAMILSDAGAGMSTLFLATLLWSGRLEVWHVYLATTTNALFGAFQWPAYSASTTLLVPKKHLGRAGGMVQMGEAVSQLISPALAGMLLVSIGLKGIMLIDFGTFAFAVLTLLIVHIPRPATSAESAAAKGSLWSEAAFGWKYIRSRPGLFGLLIFFSIGNFLGGMLSPLLIPMILDLSSPDVMGYVASIVGVGMLAGTLVMSAWGGPQRRVMGILGFEAIAGVLIVVMGIQASIPLIAAMMFGVMFCMPIVNGCSQALWQSKVKPDLQGRVFAVRRMIAMAASPLAYVVVGPLADGVFEPLMAADGPLTASVGRVIGSGPGRGYGLMFMVMGGLLLVTAAVAYLYPRIRFVEDELPDVVAEAAQKTEIGPAGEHRERLESWEPVGASSG
jgi:MFS family permease